MSQKLHSFSVFYVTCELAYIILSHLCLDTITCALNILNSVLNLICCWDVLPSVEERFLFHVSFLREEDVDGGDGRKVEDVHVVFDSNLDIGQWIHLLNRS